MFLKLLTAVLCTAFVAAGVQPASAAQKGGGIVKVKPAKTVKTVKVGWTGRTQVWLKTFAMSDGTEYTCRFRSGKWRNKRGFVYFRRVQQRCVKTHQAPIYSDPNYDPGLGPDPCGPSFRGGAGSSSGCDPQVNLPCRKEMEGCNTGVNPPGTVTHEDHWCTFDDGSESRFCDKKEYDEMKGCRESGGRWIKHEGASTCSFVVCHQPAGFRGGANPSEHPHPCRNPNENSGGGVG